MKTPLTVTDVTLPIIAWSCLVDRMAFRRCYITCLENHYFCNL